MALKALSSLAAEVKEPGGKLLIFQCYGGTHSSVTAASIYLNLLPRNRLPTRRELIRLPYFDRIKNDEVGPLRYMGRDRRGCRVFVMGSREWSEEIKKLFKDLLPLLAVPPPAALLLNCFPGLNLLARIGGFISCRLGVPALGRPLVCQGIRLHYHRLLRQVELLESRPDLFALDRP